MKQLRKFEVVLTANYIDSFFRGCFNGVRISACKDSLELFPHLRGFERIKLTVSAYKIPNATKVEYCIDDDEGMITKIGKRFISKKDGWLQYWSSLEKIVYVLNLPKKGKLFIKAEGN